MKEPEHDDEWLAALLDGKLNERERDELLAALPASTDDYDVFVETAAILQELEDEEQTPERNPARDDVIPLQPRARSVWRPPARWAALAAAIAGIAVATTLATRSRAPRADPVVLAARLEQGLPAGWLDSTGWSSSRGEGGGGANAMHAVRAGARLTELAVAVRARDSAATHEIAEQLRTRYDAQAPASPFHQIAQRAGAPADSLTPLVSAGTDRLRRLGRANLELGAWLEAASLAAHARDEAFFRDRRMLRSAERLARDDEAARQAFSRVHDSLPADGPPLWAPLRAGLRALLRELASE